MMAARGYEVVLYAPEGSDDTHCEVVECISEVERVATFGADDPNGLPRWPTDDEFALFNRRAAAAIAERAGPEDPVLLTAGWSQRGIKEALPAALCCEPGVGYEGIVTPYCAYESNAWRHYLYGKWGVGDGRWYDTVIPNYFDADDFHTAEGGRDDYLLFVGRLIGRKGPHIAVEIAKATGRKLIVAGPGAIEHSEGLIVAPEVRLEGPVEYAGPVGIEERAELMANAHAVLVPTTYIEPFGGVAVEAMLSGSPAITSPWGAFSETVDQGKTGFRFATLADAIEAVEAAGSLDSTEVRELALERFSLEAVGLQFADWFEKLGTLWRDGWYTRPGVEAA